MSTKEANRITHIQRLMDGEINNETAAGLLQQSVRQVQRLKKKAINGGIEAVLHARRGRFARQETRKVQSGMLVSFQGKRYKVPVTVNNIRVSARPSDPIVVAHSERIGLRMICNGLTFTPQELQANPSASITPRQPQPMSTERRQAAGRAGKAASPWRMGYKNMPVRSRIETSEEVTFSLNT